MNDWVFWLVKFIAAVIIMTMALVVMAFMVYFERKVSAFMQSRIGPNRAGPGGWLQSFADALKLLTKEDTIPGGADKVVFRLAPIVSFFASLAAFSIIPFGPHWGPYDPWYIADVAVGALVILGLSSLGVYGVIMAGWSSNSKYPLLGGLRSTAQVLSYEITLGISLVGVFMLSSSLSLVQISGSQSVLHSAGTPGLWYILLQPVAFMIFLTSAVAETNRLPFDFPESEQELVSGYHTEYSGMRFGLFYLGEYIAMMVVSAIASVMFFGGWSSPFDAFVYDKNIPFISGLLGGGPHWFVLKMAAFLFFYLWVRWTLPRFRYDQLMGLCWKVFLPITLANIMVIAVLKLIFFPTGAAASAPNPLFWWILVAIELVLGALAIAGASRLAGISWFGRAERPLLIDRSLIMVRTTQGGRPVIPGEARPAPQREG